MYPRYVQPLIVEALADRPVVFLNGARQVGKSTLAQSLISPTWPAQYVSLDEASTLARAKRDPQGFVLGFDGSVIIDEIQRVPELFLALKLAVDRDRQPGRFLVTGSTSALLLPQLLDALVGRMEIEKLQSLAQSELEGTTRNLIDSAFDTPTLSAFRPERTVGRDDIVQRILLGGYPEVLGLSTQKRRQAWFEDHVIGLLNREVRDLANIDGLADLPRLARLIAARSSSITHVADLSRSAGLNQTTLNRYVSLLEAIFLMERIPAWSTNTTKRLVRSPKWVIYDSGVMGYLLDLDDDRLEANPHLFGALLETFVVAELRKLSSWSRHTPSLYHFHEHGGREVDIVLERRSGEIVGIEVKATSNPGPRDGEGLRALAELAGDRFVCGLLLYTGSETLPMGEKLFQVPMSALWM